MAGVGRAACSVIQILGHFTVSARGEAALTHGDGELHIGARDFRRGAGTNAGPDVPSLGLRELPSVNVQHVGPVRFLLASSLLTARPMWDTDCRGLFVVPQTPSVRPARSAAVLDPNKPVTLTSADETGKMSAAGIWRGGRGRRVVRAL